MSTETVPAPAGQGASERAYREYVTESQRRPPGAVLSGLQRMQEEGVLEAG